MNNDEIDLDESAMFYVWYYLLPDKSIKPLTKEVLDTEIMKNHSNIKMLELINYDYLLEEFYTKSEAIITMRKFRQESCMNLNFVLLEVY